MEVRINNKIYQTEITKETLGYQYNYIVITLNSGDMWETAYFKEWIHEAKSDGIIYAIKYVDGNNCGILKHCLPLRVKDVAPGCKSVKIQFNNKVEY
jgi:hypothetical protein